MGGYIRRRAKGSWEVRVELGRDPVTGKRRRKTETVRGIKRDAERVQARLLHSLETGYYVEPGKLTVGDFLKRWLEDYARPNLAPRTFERYDEIVQKRLIPDLGAHKLSKLQPVHIVSAETAWRQKLAPRTVLKFHRLLHKALQDAVKWQILGRNPVAAIELPVGRGQEMRFLNREEVQRLLKAAKDSPWFALLVTAIYTGMRRGELLGLKWDDIDLRADSVSVRRTLQRLKGGALVFGEPKTHRSSRTVSLPSVVVEVLRQYRKQQVERRLELGADYHDNGLVFANDLGAPVSEGELRGAFARLLKASGLPTIRFHDLRHTMATLMLAQGVHPKVVSERLGHSTVNITLDTYSHVLPNLQAEAAERLADWLSESPTASGAQSK